MASKEWIEYDSCSIDTSSAVVYEKASMNPRAWQSLKTSVLATQAAAKLTPKSPTKIIFVSRNLILLV